jgi:hypothetical protein
MRRRLLKCSLGQTGLLAALCLAGSLVHAEQPCPVPSWTQPFCPTPPGYPYAPGSAMPTTPMPPPGTMAQPGGAPAVEGGAAGTAGATFASLSAGAGVGSSVALAAPGGYIDNAIPKTMFRLRFDAAYNDNRPDRAEFFYAKCGCNGANSPGPPLSETSVDYQEISAYLEAAIDKRFSGFVEVPVRFLNPDVNRDFTGIGDMNAGLKWAFVACEDRFLTFQLRTFIPTGDAFRGLGTRHVSLEPALLAYQRLTDRLVFEAELRDWIPINGTDYAGNVLRYGVGLGYDIVQRDGLRITPIAEFVGWTVLGGKELAVAGTQAATQDAAGDTIVNMKLGARTYFGPHSDLYVGWGRALTGAVWYKDIFRAEYRWVF